MDTLKTTSNHTSAIYNSKNIQALSQPKEKNEKSQVFNDILKNFDKTTQKTEEEPNLAVEDFIDSLLEKGSLTFLAELNQEKIDKLVEEYKQKLLKEMGDNPDTLKEIDSLVADFKKQLLEKLENSLDNDNSELKISSHAMVKTFMDILDAKPTPLSSLLQQKS